MRWEHFSLLRLRSCGVCLEKVGSTETRTIEAFVLIRFSKTNVHSTRVAAALFRNGPRLECRWGSGAAASRLSRSHSVRRARGAKAIKRAQERVECVFWYVKLFFSQINPGAGWLSRAFMSSLTQYTVSIRFFKSNQTRRERIPRYQISPAARAFSHIHACICANSRYKFSHSRSLHTFSARFAFKLAHQI